MRASDRRRTEYRGRWASERDDHAGLVRLGCRPVTQDALGFPSARSGDEDLQVLLTRQTGTGGYLGAKAVQVPLFCQQLGKPISQKWICRVDGSPVPRRRGTEPLRVWG